MDYIINGKSSLNGELPVYGAKNCALALLGATVLTEDCIVLQNCPKIVDVENMLALLRFLGKNVQRSGNTVAVSGGLTSTDVPPHLGSKLRGSGLILGGTVARYGRVFLPATGGCAIGARPMDIHLDGLRAMGISVDEGDLGVLCQGVPQGCNFRLRFASVGATENLLCAAAMCNGQITLQNCALEPEVVALQLLLQKMGAKICGIGAPTVTVSGASVLHGATVTVIPDRIVASTYLACVAAAGGKVTVTNCCPQHFGAFLQILSKRFEVEVGKDFVTLQCFKPPKDYGRTVTAPYPAFPTDVQQILLSLCAMSGGGTSYICEKLFENRLAHNSAQLCAMGGDICVVDDTAKIVGKPLHGANVVAKDLRGGAGLVVAALGAQGQTKISGVENILRGYCNFAESLRSVGADITIEN